MSRPVSGDGSNLCLGPFDPERKLYSHASQTSVESGTGSAQFGQFLNARRSTGWCCLVFETPLFFALMDARTAMVNRIAKRKKPFRSSAITSIAPSIRRAYRRINPNPRAFVCQDIQSNTRAQTKFHCMPQHSAMLRTIKGHPAPIMGMIRERVI